MDNNLTSRQLQAIQTKNKILNAAINLVKKLGFEKVTIALICKEANVSIGSFYYHFKSLDFIIAEYYSNFDKFLKNLNENGTFNLPLMDKILSILKEQLTYAKNQDLELATQFYKSQMTIGNKYFLSNDRFLPKLLLNTIIDAQNSGLLDKSLSANEIVEDLLIITRGSIYNWCLRQGNFDLVSRGFNLCEIYLNGLHLDKFKTT